LNTKEEATQKGEGNTSRFCYFQRGVGTPPGVGVKAPVSLWRKGGETVPIKWSAVKVDETMDAVEHQLDLAASFLNEAKAIAAGARKIPDLPQYLDQRILRVVLDIERMDAIRSATTSVRNSIPDGSIEAERARVADGKQQHLI
jgi:hypothetical protein